MRIKLKDQQKYRQVYKQSAQCDTKNKQGIIISENRYNDGNRKDNYCNRESPNVNERIGFIKIVADTRRLYAIPVLHTAFGTRIFTVEKIRVFLLCVRTKSFKEKFFDFTARIAAFK